MLPEFFCIQTTAIGVSLPLWHVVGCFMGCVAVPPPPAVRVPGAMTSAFSYIKQLEDMVSLSESFAPGSTLELNETLARARQLFHAAFFIRSCNCYHETEQAGDVMALASGSVPEALRANVVDHLLSLVASDGYHFSVGIVSFPFLFNVLHDAGHADVALRILTQADYPSFGYTMSNR